MESDLKNVILFPTLQKNLEQDSKLALEAKKYPEALEKLNELLRYKVQKHEIFIGKLICLMELGRNNEALDLCEDLLRRKDADRSEEHTSELQSRGQLVCRLLLEKKDHRNRSCVGQRFH